MASAPQQTSDYSLGFKEPAGEISVSELPVEGALPSWLSGSLVRLTPTRFEAEGVELNHWFDGQAMLHGFGINNGKVSYTNRWLRSRQLEAMEGEGRIRYREFATDPCRSIFKRFMTLFKPDGQFTDNGVVNLTKLGDEYLALTETPLPVRFDPETLRTLGISDWASEIPGLLTTAHPHGDRGLLINYTGDVGLVNRYRFYTMEPGGKPQVAAEMRIREPAYVHSFALTPRFFILTEIPYVVSPLALALSGRPYIENFRWEPERGTRFLLFDRSLGRLRASFEVDPFFVFHHVNAFENHDEVVVDLCAYEDPSIIDSLYLARIRSSEHSAPPPARLWRYRLDVERGMVRDEQLTPIPFELPRINYGPRNCQPYRYAYGVSANNPEDFLNVLAKVDVRDGSFHLWHEPGCYPSEPVFVPEPGRRAEDGGVVLSVVLDSASGHSFLLALEATSWLEIGRAELPQHVPFGFHGDFFAATAGREPV
jgi:beta,beta-carotene 9',10'-dioxygenase